MNICNYCCFTASGNSLHLPAVCSVHFTRSFDYIFITSCFILKRFLPTKGLVCIKLLLCSCLHHNWQCNCVTYISISTTLNKERYFVCQLLKLAHLALYLNWANLLSIIQIRVCAWISSYSHCRRHAYTLSYKYFSQNCIEKFR